MQKNNDIFDEIFNDSPFEHLVKILPNVAPQALYNTLERFFAEYASMSLLIEDNALDSKLLEYTHDSRIDSAKQDLAIKMMSDILSQGD